MPIRPQQVQGAGARLHACVGLGLQTGECHSLEGLGRCGPELNRFSVGGQGLVRLPRSLFNCSSFIKKAFALSQGSGQPLFPENWLDTWAFACISVSIGEHGKNAVG